MPQPVRADRRVARSTSSRSPPSSPGCTRRRCGSTTGSAWSRPAARPAAAAATPPRDIELLREVQRLSQDEGINLAGIKRIIELEHEVAGG